VDERLKASQIGERALVRYISKFVNKIDNLRTIGIGDDCAAVPVDDDYLLITTDMITAKTHIPTGMTPYQTGWHIVAINLSDIAAKGGKPIGIVVSLGLKSNTELKFVKALAQGMQKCASTYGTSIIGGDTKQSSDLTLSGTAIGLVPKSEIMLRRGAQPGDTVAVTSEIGTAALGYYALKHRLNLKRCIKKFLQPLPRVYEGRALAQTRCVTSAIDISDGLAASIHQIGMESKVGFQIDFASIPKPFELEYIKKIKKSATNVRDIVLYFGGDYELLVTIKKNRFRKCYHLLKHMGVSLTAIGSVTKHKRFIAFENNTEFDIENKGYEHFKH
jgi:thiamine-monophosphate kinase